MSDPRIHIPSDWKVLKEDVIPNSQIPNFWEMLAIGAWWSHRAYYGRWRGEVRGYLGQERVSVPRWARAILWLKSRFRKGPVTTYGRAVQK